MKQMTDNNEPQTESKGYFKRTIVTMWKWLDDNSDGYMIIRRGRRYYSVLVEDDGNWGEKSSFNSLDEAQEFILEDTSPVSPTGLFRNDEASDAIEK